jgi:hypothetical protein
VQRAAALRGGGETPPDLAHALIAALIGFTVGAFFLSLAYSEMLYMLLALTVGFCKVTEKRWEKTA